MLDTIVVCYSAVSSDRFGDSKIHYSKARRLYSQKTFQKKNCIPYLPPQTMINLYCIFQETIEKYVKEEESEVQKRFKHRR